jgi:ubiquinone/menaquinone biosynthesis C-methylase UbiE
MKMYLDKIATYWDTRAEGYSETIQHELESGSADRYRELLRSALAEQTGGEALDIGCGPGLFSILLNEMGMHVISADYSPEMLERTKQNCADAGFTANAVRADAQNLPFENASFDFICSRNLVWNLEHPEKAYSEWMRVLKPGGRLFVFDGNHYLYYYNEDYRKAREATLNQGKAVDHSTKGVDPTPINDIARDLPLSKELRPEWDVKTLTDLGMKILNVERHARPFIDPESGEEKMLTHSFALWGEK